MSNESNWVRPVLCLMVSMLALSVVDHGFESRSGQIRDYKYGIWIYAVSLVNNVRKK